MIFSIILLTAFATQAATKTATVSGNWSNTKTWGGKAVPVANYIVVINGGVNVSLDVNTAAASILLSDMMGCTTSLAVGAFTLNTGSIKLGPRSWGKGSNVSKTNLSVSIGIINCTGALSYLKQMIPIN